MQESLENEGKKYAKMNVLCAKIKIYGEENEIYIFKSVLFTT